MKHLSAFGRLHDQFGNKLCPRKHTLNALGYCSLSTCKHSAGGVEARRDALADAAPQGYADDNQCLDCGYTICACVNESLATVAGVPYDAIADTNDGVHALLYGCKPSEFRKRISEQRKAPGLLEAASILPKGSALFGIEASTYDIWKGEALSESTLKKMIDETVKNIAKNMHDMSSPWVLK